MVTKGEILLKDFLTSKYMEELSDIQSFALLSGYFIKDISVLSDKVKVRSFLFYKDALFFSLNFEQDAKDEKKVTISMDKYGSVYGAYQKVNLEIDNSLEYLLGLLMKF